MEETERIISALIMEAESLKFKRYDLLMKKEDLELKEAMDCAIEAGITAEEIMQFVTNTSREKKRQKEVTSYTRH